MCPPTNQLLEEKVRVELQLELFSTTVLSDYELAIMPGARAVFPAVSIKGCYFHFCHALLHEVQDLGLRSDYRSNSELHSFVRNAAAVAFVHSDTFAYMGWIGIKAVLPNVPRIEELWNSRGHGFPATIPRRRGMYTILMTVAQRIIWRAGIPSLRKY